jgi:hypothetical protein
MKQQNVKAHSDKANKITDEDDVDVPEDIGNRPNINATI